MTGPHMLRSHRLILFYVPDIEILEVVGPGRCGVYYARLDEDGVANDDGAAVGAISITGMARSHGEIGYLIAPSFQGQGLATEALRTVIAASHAQHGFSVLTARARADNFASQAVLAKCGFEPASAKLCWDRDGDGAVTMLLFRRVSDAPDP